MALRPAGSGRGAPAGGWIGGIQEIQSFDAKRQATEKTKMDMFGFGLASYGVDEGLLL
jgi:hypothetical protein